MSEPYLEGWKQAMRGLDAEVIWAEKQRRVEKSEQARAYLDAQKYLQQLLSGKLARMMLVGVAADGE